MNAFGIYMIVLSVAYFLYYVANITIDWNKKDPATQVMESVDVEGVVGQDEPIEEEVVEEEVEEQLQDGDGLVTGGSMDENQDHTKYMPSSEPESTETDEITVEHEEAIENETPIENGDPIEKKDEDGDVEEPKRVEVSAHPEEQEEVPTVEPVSSAMEANSEGGSSDEDDFDPFCYTPSVSPYNVVSVVSQPKQRTEADDKADAVNDSMEEASIRSYDDIEGRGLDKLLSDEKALNDKKIVYRHDLESL